MIRQYSNKRIYTNLKVVKVISIVAIIFAIVALVIDITIIARLRLDIETSFALYHLMSLLIPFIHLQTTQELPWQSKPKETKMVNDFTNLLIPIILTLFQLIIYFFVRVFGSNLLLYLPNALIYISTGFLISTCVLIKREWKDNPPQFAKKEYEEKVRKYKEKEYQNNETTYKLLIEQCGIRFFIKYYKQINRLPLRDVNVTENYSSVEREERLLAAKKIIELNLVEFTFNEILKSYSDILDEKEIEQVNDLLSEVRVCSKQDTQSVPTPPQKTETPTDPLYNTGPIDPLWEDD